MIFAAPNLTIEECCEYLNQGALSQCNLFQNIHIKKSQRSFLSKIYHEKHKTDPRPKMFQCPFCKKRFLNIILLLIITVTTCRIDRRLLVVQLFTNAHSNTHVRPLAYKRLQLVIYMKRQSLSTTKFKAQK